MLFPKKVKHRKWQTGRKSETRLASMKETRGTTVAFGSYGLKATTLARVRSNQIEAARKAMSRQLGKTGKYWIRVFPDRPFTAKPNEVGMGKGKGDPQGFCAEVKPGKIVFEVDNVPADIAREALRKAGTKLPVKTKIVER
ncbi:50S ribosomal protein L16 [Candidatus Nomurabacteria bacterium]|nr:50S ribosomal protein L16 [Candidatus Nomurabacteria bacterium]MCB9820756.1 50S ribosomal protein L16 [Candidatus Nomurabacteria bacterium]